MLDWTAGPSTSSMTHTAMCQAEPRGRSLPRCTQALKLQRSTPERSLGHWATNADAFQLSDRLLHAPSCNEVYSITLCDLLMCEAICVTPQILQSYRSHHCMTPAADRGSKMSDVKNSCSMSLVLVTRSAPEQSFWSRLDVDVPQASAYNRKGEIEQKPRKIKHASNLKAPTFTRMAHLC